MRQFGKSATWGSLFAVTVILTPVRQGMAADTRDTGSRVDAIFQGVKSPDAPGCAVGIEYQGTPAILRGYGSADLEHNIPIGPETIFEAGSVSKQFTAASILMLAQQGKLALTDDIRKYLPELPDYGSPITINELLGHTSGLRDWSDLEAMTGWPRSTRVYGMDDVLDMTARQKSLNFPSGTFYSYTNGEYDLLALIVARVGGESLAEFDRTHLFEPLGMTHTQWRDNFRRVVKNRAIAYHRGREGFEQLMPFEDTYGHGGLLTTVGDLLRWNDALSSGALGPYVTAELQRQSVLNDGHPIAYARGLVVGSYNGQREISHSGHTAGYTSWLARYPDAHLSVALLCNSDSAGTRALSHAVADLFLPKPSSSAAITISADELAQRAGVYVDTRQHFPLKLTVQNGGLRMANGTALVPISPDAFRMDDMTFRFQGNDRFTREAPDDEPLEYRRVESWSPDADELKSLVGRYRSGEILATYDVAVKDGHIVAAPIDRPEAALTLRPAYKDNFFAVSGDGPLMLRFVHGSGGEVTGLEMRSGRVYSLIFDRLDSNAIH